MAGWHTDEMVQNSKIFKILIWRHVNFRCHFVGQSLLLNTIALNDNALIVILKWHLLGLKQIYQIYLDSFVNFYSNYFCIFVQLISGQTSQNFTLILHKHNVFSSIQVHRNIDFENNNIYIINIFDHPKTYCYIGYPVCLC